MKKMFVLMLLFTTFAVAQDSAGKRAYFQNDWMELQEGVEARFTETGSTQYRFTGQAGFQAQVQMMEEQLDTIYDVLSRHEDPELEKKALELEDVRNDLQLRIDQGMVGEATAAMKACATSFNGLVSASPQVAVADVEASYNCTGTYRVDLLALVEADGSVTTRTERPYDVREPIDQRIVASKSGNCFSDCYSKAYASASIFDANGVKVLGWTEIDENFSCLLSKPLQVLAGSNFMGCMNGLNIYQGTAGAIFGNCNYKYQWTGSVGVTIMSPNSASTEIRVGRNGGSAKVKVTSGSETKDLKIFFEPRCF